MKEQHFSIELKQINKEAFSLLFRTYYKDLVLFCGNYLKDRMACEDIVQSVFLKLWNDRDTLSIETSLKSYLLTAVKNRCLNELQHRDIVQDHISYIHSNPTLETFNTENYILYSDLHEHFLAALQKLPEQCRIAFEMNRIKGLKYKEISEQLNCPIRTVEARIAKALELLRKQLKDFMPLFIYFFG